MKPPLKELDLLSKPSTTLSPNPLLNTKLKKLLLKHLSKTSKLDSNNLSET